MITDNRLEIGRAKINMLTFAGAVDRIVELSSGERTALVVNPNVDCVVQLERSAELRRAYERATLQLADGAPLILAARLMRMPLPGRVVGADLFPALVAEAADRDLSIAIVGGMDQTCNTAVGVLKVRHPQLRVLCQLSPSAGFDPQSEEASGIVAMLRDLRPDLIFLALGAPLQERFAMRMLDEGRGGCIVCIGAALDFVAGMKRAPSWMRRIGMEWFFRLLKEPKRLARRYLVRDVAFLRIMFRAIRGARLGRA